MTRLYDSKSGYVVAVITGHVGVIDEILEMYEITLDDEGQLVGADGGLIDAWYDDLVVEYL